MAVFPPVLCGNNPKTPAEPRKREAGLGTCLGTSFTAERLATAFKRAMAGAEPDPTGGVPGGWGRGASHPALVAGIEGRVAAPAGHAIPASGPVDGWESFVR